MQETIRVKTSRHNELVDITEQVRGILQKAKINTGLVNVYVQGATAGIMIQENWDNSVQNDVVSFLSLVIPAGVLVHDAQTITAIRI